MDKKTKKNKPEPLESTQFNNLNKNIPSTKEALIFSEYLWCSRHLGFLIIL